MKKYYIFIHDGVEMTIQADRLERGEWEELFFFVGDELVAHVRNYTYWRLILDG